MGAASSFKLHLSPSLRAATIIILYTYNILYSTSTYNRMPMDSDYQNLASLMPAKIKEREEFEANLAKPFGQNELDPFLNKIQGLESSYGTNTEHPIINVGVNAGDQAIGKYALVPNTIQDIARKVGNRNTQLGASLPYGTQLEPIQALKGVNKDELKGLMDKNPGLEDQLGRLLAKDIMLKSNGEDDAAYRWHSGQNIPRDKVTPEMLQGSEYVQRFKKLRGLVSR